MVPAIKTTSLAVLIDYHTDNLPKAEQHIFLHGFQVSGNNSAFEDGTAFTARVGEGISMESKLSEHQWSF